MNAFDRAAISATRSALDRARDAVELLTPDTEWLRLCQQYDPAAAIRGLRAERLTGVEKEVSDTLDRRRPLTEANSCYIPWETLAFRRARYNATRADIVGSLGVGGYLVSTVNYTSAAQALLPMLVAGRLGITAIDAAGPNINLPRVTGSATPQWLSTESIQVTESDQTFGQVSFAPHTVGGYTEMSRLLTLQSTPDAGDVVANDLSRKLAREIDRVIFAGTGAAGQPHGISGMAGVGTLSGTTFALATACSAATGTGDALTDDANPGWATTRAVASLLRQRQEFGSGSAVTIWQGPLTWGTLADVPAAGTSGIAAATAFFGNWRYLVLVNWGGLQLSLNPYANFPVGIVGMRALATIDVGCVWPGAFTQVTTIT